MFQQQALSSIPELEAVAAQPATTPGTHANTLPHRNDLALPSLQDASLVH